MKFAQFLKSKFDMANKEKLVPDLTITEFETLMIKCFEILKQRELDTSMKEYDRISYPFLQ